MTQNNETKVLTPEQIENNKQQGVSIGYPYSILWAFNGYLLSI